MAAFSVLLFVDFVVLGLLVGAPEVEALLFWDSLVILAATSAVGVVDLLAFAFFSYYCLNDVMCLVPRCTLEGPAVVGVRAGMAVGRIVPDKRVLM